MAPPAAPLPSRELRELGRGGEGEPAWRWLPAEPGGGVRRAAMEPRSVFFAAPVPSGQRGSAAALLGRRFCPRPAPGSRSCGPVLPGRGVGEESRSLPPRGVGRRVRGGLRGARDVGQAPKSSGGGSVTPWKRSFRPGANHLAPHTFLRGPEVPPSRRPAPAPTLASRGPRRGERAGRGRPLPPLLSGEEPGAPLALTAGADRAAPGCGRGRGVGAVVGGGSGLCGAGGGTPQGGARGSAGGGRAGRLRGRRSWRRGSGAAARRVPARGGEERGGDLAPRRESLPLPSRAGGRARWPYPRAAAAEGTRPGGAHARGRPGGGAHNAAPCVAGCQI